MKLKHLMWLAGILASMTTVDSSQSAETCSNGQPDELKVELLRLGTDEVIDHNIKTARIFGDVGVNNRNMGRFYENPQKKIPAGSYRGLLRYDSNHDFVQSSCGEMSREGDFLLEIADVTGADGKKRTNILFHPGILPSHSDGCILFGARARGADGQLLPLSFDSPLVKIRREFYGTDNPISCPNKSITIIIKDP